MWENEVSTYGQMVYAQMKVYTRNYASKHSQGFQYAIFLHEEMAKSLLILYRQTDRHKHTHTHTHTHTHIYIYIYIYIYINRFGRKPRIVSFF